MSVRIPVQPDTYFKRFAENNRAPRNGTETSTRLPKVLHEWVQYARTDVGGGQRTKTDIASLAVDFGASRPLVSWGLPAQQFTEIRSRMIDLKMSGDDPLTMPGPMDTTHSLQLTGDPVKLNLDQNTMDLLDQHQSLLEIGQSDAIRHSMAISFYWYSQDVFNGDEAQDYRQQIEPYAMNFKRELEGRVQYARDQLDMDHI